MLLDTSMKVLYPSILVLAFYFLVAGHNRPGGGFVGGLVVAKAIRRRRYGDARGGHGSATQTLQDRFARGEIGQAEYDHRKAVLDGADVIPPAPEPAPAAATSAPAAAEAPTTDPSDDDA